MRLILLSLFSLFILPLAANAEIKPCKNNNAKPYQTKADGTYICVHKHKYYVKDNKCPSSYQLVGTKCKRYKSATKKCTTGQKVCGSGNNSYCVDALKACKSSNKKGTPSITCTGSGWRADGNRCSKSKEAKDTKCPTGFFKTNYKPSSSHPNQFYCKTNR